MQSKIMDINDLRKALNEGVVIFDFVKKDGTHRDARGTTCPDLIPADNMPKPRLPLQGKERKRGATVPFYDIDKKAWRSMRIDAIWNWKRALKLSE